MKSFIERAGLYNKGTYLKLIAYLLLFTSTGFYAIQGIHPRRAALVAMFGILILMLQEFIYVEREI